MSRAQCAIKLLILLEDRGALPQLMHQLDRIRGCDKLWNMQYYFHQEKDVLHEARKSSQSLCNYSNRW
jgi:hypothetical protein